MSTICCEVDARGMNCPLPILRVKKSLNGIGSGELLKLVATDPGAVKDMEAFCRQTGHEMISFTEGGGVFEFVIRKQ